MNDLLRDQRVDTLKRWTEKIASRHTWHGNELPALFVISFQGNGQVNPVIHLKSYLQCKISMQLLRDPEACLHRVRIVVISSGLGDASIRLARGRNDPKRSYVRIGKRNEWKFGEANAISPRSE